MGELFVALIMGSIIVGAIWMVRQFGKTFADHRLELAEDAQRLALCRRNGWRFWCTPVRNWSFWGVGFSLRSPESRWTMSGDSALIGTWQLNFRSDSPIRLRFISRGNGHSTPQAALVHHTVRERENSRLSHALKATISRALPNLADSAAADAMSRLFDGRYRIALQRPQGYEWLAGAPDLIERLHADTTLNDAFADLVETLPGVYLADTHNRRTLSLMLSPGGSVNLEGAAVSALSADEAARIVEIAERAAHCTGFVANAAGKPTQP
ncbi:MAG: hypothetical protein ACK4KV_06235 [Rhodocyclaceae bacterium]